MVKTFYLVLSILFLIFISIEATAEEQELYDMFIAMMSGSYIDNVSDLPPSSNPMPDRNWQPGDGDWIYENCNYETGRNCIYGWLDIVGYNNSIRSGDAYFIQGNPKDLAIIEYKTYIRINQGLLLERWEYDLEKSESNGSLYVRLHAVAVLYRTDGRGHKLYNNESYDFYDSEPVPEQYPLLKDSPVYITIYNHSFEPKTSVQFSVPAATKIKVSYQNSSLEYYKQIAIVEYTGKNVPFGNLTAMNSWEKQGDEVSHIGNEIIVNGIAEPRDIVIQASSPFETVTLRNYTVYTQNPSLPFKSVFFPFALVLLVLYAGISKILRSI
ncbi:hypothetical protein ANME2D_02441 [Candidatus Methanoperedens nitroreducens]|uniref:Uncharacterized protein n=1 Tax=Candidatus Methanoperedens nitratireducens TaxID=1392998 RepID=A0A062V766_9EURY|nr:hypothetical protein [Candidatus Methanoperedens nitroreducens]KCZ71240.1 hypothetical protein ANME2D_02441 [Candidatus Methanoperedens nitroreducens]MDJ1420334.1 hypothetical protein [Candidatus Methanoperedens sp.]